MNETLKRWLISTGVTFLAGFSVELLSNWQGVTLDALKDGTIVGIIFLAVRSGVKGILELAVAYWGKQ